MLETFSFSLPQLLSILGLVQAVYILVHIVMEDNKARHSFAPIAYFFVLATAFFLDFAHQELHRISTYYVIAQWLAWIYLPPLSVLFIAKLYSPKQSACLLSFSTLLLPVMAYGLATVMTKEIAQCTRPENCPQFIDALLISGSIAGFISLLVLWGNRELIINMHETTKDGKERYWLSLGLIIMNIALLSVIMLGFSEDFNALSGVLTRTFIGLSFVYLTTTSLFRIYPSLIKESVSTDTDRVLSKEEEKLAKKIDNLLLLEKVYQEPSYSRRDLANELDISEIALSRIINIHFQKSFPQLMNDHRLEDAKRLLEQTDASIKIIAQDAGFNSLASFNRVFRKTTGLSPSQFRAKK